MAWSDLYFRLRAGNFDKDGNERTLETDLLPVPQYKSGGLSSECKYLGLSFHDLKPLAALPSKFNHRRKGWKTKELRNLHEFFL